MPVINNKHKRRPWMGKQRTAQSGRHLDNQKFYNSKKWRDCSKVYRAGNPLCEVCLYLNDLIDAEMVDHVIPIRLGGDPYDERNLMAMSHRQHNRKSGMEKSRGVLVSHIVNDAGYKIPKNREDILVLLMGGRG